MDAILLITVLLFSIVVHEVAHAWQARREGDDTADKLGRITLNPLPHLDLMGSLIVPVALYFSGTGFLFGWAKPVPVNPANYREYVAGDIRVSLAGIVSNLGLALIATVLTAILVKIQGTFGSFGGALEPAFIALNYSIFINLILAFFNLIPIPPLDGSHVMAHLLPEHLAMRYRHFGQYGVLALMGIMYFVPGAFSVVLWPVLRLQGLADWFIRLWI
ncbi:MAG: site-2 protease family protein [Gemmatimonadetes bacterium]|nr:site-2 protease family protein [Gemmatimonadota bacterium]MDA1104038.1 site-2 protease family protein [Gemmatimonadota bacterium]